MADIALTSANIRPLTGAVLRRYVAGAALTVGYAVYIAADGDVEHADANADGLEQVIGIVVAGYDGETTIAAGDPVTVCVFGPVSGFSGMTPADTIWLSDTVGLVADAAATFDRIVGYAESASVLFVNPVRSVAASE